LAGFQTIIVGRIWAIPEVQSFLIRDAYLHSRHMDLVNAATSATNEPVELVFVTHEIALPAAGHKMVCDLLALRRDGGRCTPVLLELKDDRMRKRLVEQVEGYSKLVDAHPGLFAELFGAILGEEITFAAPMEKWIVWPGTGEGPDRWEGELAAKGIRVVQYEEHKDENASTGEVVLSYSVRVGRGIV
jgi:hypothetical protein